MNLFRKQPKEKKKMETKEVMIKESMTPAQLSTEWGVEFKPSSDMVIPKILPQQGLSKFVVERKAMIGEFRDSISGKLMGSIDKPFEFIPFYVQKTWDVLEQQADGSYKYAKSIPLIEDIMHKEYNDNLPWEGEGLDKDGKKVKVKNIRRMNFFVLIPSEIEDGSAMPYVLSFKSTSLKEGKKLWTQMYVRQAKAGLPPAATAVSLGGTMVTNAKGSFVVPQVSFGRQTTQAELAESLNWLKMIRGNNNVKVDNSDITHEEVEVAGEPTDF